MTNLSNTKQGPISPQDSSEHCSGCANPVPKPDENGNLNIKYFHSFGTIEHPQDSSGCHACRGNMNLEHSCYRYTNQPEENNGKK